jgi:hypothetical protein
MAIYNPQTNTYKVFNQDKTFSTYTPKQFEEKFGTTPEPVEDVTDVVEEEKTRGVGIADVPKEPETVGTVPAPEEQAEIDEMVDRPVTVAEAAIINADLPEGVEPLKAGDIVKMSTVEETLQNTEVPDSNQN